VEAALEEPSSFKQDCRPIHGNTSSSIEETGKPISQNIRRTLDLDTIWQQTVDSLGEALGVSHCIICPYKPGLQVQVVAGIPPNRCSQCWVELPIANDPAFCQALKRLEPIVVEQTEHPHFQQQSLLVVLLLSDQPNALISLHQCVRVSANVAGAVPNQETRQWTAAEIELVRGRSSWNGDRPRHPLQELELARQAEESSASKASFWRIPPTNSTPLNGMLGFLKLILEGMADDPEEQQEFIRRLTALPYTCSTSLMTSWILPRSKRANGARTGSGQVR